MTFRKAYFLCFCILIGSYQAVIGQTAIAGLSDSLNKKFNYYNLSKPEAVLYAHFDKTIYTNNENVWFTAYLLNSNKSQLNDVLSVMLVKDNDHSIAMSDKFVVTGGICPGNLFLPDTIAPGNYSFMLCTNQVSGGRPAYLFVQPVTIKNTNENSFKATLELLDTAEYPPGGTRKIRLVTQTTSVKIVAGATVKYSVGDKVNGVIKTDKAGQYIFTVPVDGVKLGNNIFEAKIAYGKETETVRLILPVFKDKPGVRFYPEGGQLSDGLMGRVGWEVKNATGAPYKVTGLLYANNKVIDTITTDSYGMGHFWLKPTTGSRYYVKLLARQFTDSVYDLPAITHAPTITMQEGLAGDTLQLVIKAKQAASIWVLVHNYRQLFSVIPLKVSRTGRPVKIDLANIPRGLAAITILDSLERPCAERLFFAHYDRRNTVVMSADKNEFKKREKVTINLKLLNPNGEAEAGNVSIACVQANRIELKKQTDIESYFYLNNELGTLPVKEGYMGRSGADKEYLENVLLIKGWRRYKWGDIANANARDTLYRQDDMNYKGVITRYKKPLTEAANLLLLRDSSTNIFSTDKKGLFTFDNNSLVTAENKKLYLFVSGQSNDGEEIIVTDPFVKINQLTATNYAAPGYDHFAPNQINGSEERLNDLEHVIHLKEVKIKGANDNSLYGGGPNRENACGDYVCLYNILNCPNHRGNASNRPPVTGEMYMYNGQRNYIYLGCTVEPNNNRFTFDGIKYSMEFYPADYGQINPPGAELLSTIYWKHQLKVSAGAENKISFYTSDITGTFKIVVQGVGGNDVVYGEKSFNVSKP
jgi:hypothetical protein